MRSRSSLRACSRRSRRRESWLADSPEGDSLPVASMTMTRKSDRRLRKPDPPSPSDASEATWAKLFYRQQLDVEHQRARRGARTAGRVAVGQAAGDPEASLVADDHQLQSLGPALDDAAERERRRLAAHDRAVEQLPVGRPAGVVNLDGAVGGGAILPLAVLED